MVTDRWILNASDLNFTAGLMGKDWVDAIDEKTKRLLTHSITHDSCLFSMRYLYLFILFQHSIIFLIHLTYFFIALPQLHSFSSFMVLISLYIVWRNFTAPLNYARGSNIFIMDWVYGKNLIKRKIIKGFAFVLRMLY